MQSPAAARRPLYGVERPPNERWAMLRITHAQGHDSISTLRREGKLLGPWVTELARACNGLRSLWGTLDRPAPAWAPGGVPVTPFNRFGGSTIMRTISLMVAALAVAVVAP